MTDSESDISNPNVFTFQNVNTTVSARGPNMNITNLSVRNQMTSTMYMPRNFERQRYAESVTDQRSMYYRRETSPMSIHSAYDIRPRNFQQHYLGMSSAKSVFNGRGASPVSMRSIDSSASVSAADIAFAFKNVKFNRYDLKVIKEAYHKLMKQRVRKRIEKRRNLRLFLKGGRNRSGDDSGEQGSDSSISSDDCRSVKTSYKENMSSNRSTRMDVTDFRKTIKDNNMFKDYTESLKQKNFKNMLSAPTSHYNRSQINSSSTSKQGYSMPTQKERFQNGFLLPSQRFNQSVASFAIPENSEKPRNMENSCRQNDKIDTLSNRQPQNRNCVSSSDEEIFSNTVKEISTHNTQSQGKRSLESDDDISLPVRKKSKISPSVKNFHANKKDPPRKNISPIKKINEDTSNFEFLIPTLPVRKSRRIEDKVISKSSQPLIGCVEPITNNAPTHVETAHPKISPVKSNDTQMQIEPPELSQNSDVSMRPSFIKRKLFTQKLDIAEKANLSNDGINSPQTVYSAIQKEKNKARKLVTSQSCLNREVQEDNNLLDLIHKIVPPDHMNITNQTSINQTKTDVNNSNKKDDDDRWDVTSVISMCKEHDVSDTFTDEEIFVTDNNKKMPKNYKKDSSTNPKTTQNASVTKISNDKEVNHNLPRECKVVVEKISNPEIKEAVETPNTNLTHTNTNKSVVKNFAKTFWDTDFESDVECQVPSQKSYIKENWIKGNPVVEVSKHEFKHPSTTPSYSPVQQKQPVLQVPETSRWLNNKNTTINDTLNTNKKLNISTLSVKSHRTSKKKKCFNETCSQEIVTKPQTIAKVVTISQSKNTKKASNSDNKNSKITNATESNSKNKCKSDIVSKDIKAGDTSQRMKCSNETCSQELVSKPQRIAKVVVTTLESKNTKVSSKSTNTTQSTSRNKRKSDTISKDSKADVSQNAAQPNKRAAARSRTNPDVSLTTPDSNKRAAARSRTKVDESLTTPQPNKRASARSRTNPDVSLTISDSNKRTAARSRTKADESLTSPQPNKRAAARSCTKADESLNTPQPNKRTSARSRTKADDSLTTPHSNKTATSKSRTKADVSQMTQPNKKSSAKSRSKANKSLASPQPNKKTPVKSRIKADGNKTATKNYTKPEGRNNKKGSPFVPKRITKKR